MGCFNNFNFIAIGIRLSPIDDLFARIQAGQFVFISIFSVTKEHLMNTIQSIMIVVTSFSEIALGEPTGLWLEEFAVPYMEFKDKGYKVSVASIQGGKAPIDPRSKPTSEQEAAWAEAIKALENTVSVASIKPVNFDAIFIPGGHGTMFDLPKSDDLNKALRSFAEQDKVIAAMCHGPASLVGVTLEDGTR